MIDYVKLTCYIGDERPTADGKYNFTVKGNYFNSSFGAQENTLSVKYRWKIAGETFSEWKDMADIASERVLPVKIFSLFDLFFKATPRNCVREPQPPFCPTSSV